MSEPHAATYSHKDVRRCDGFDSGLPNSFLEKDVAYATACRATAAASASPGGELCLVDCARSDPGNQLGGIGVSGYDGPPPGLAFAQSIFAEDKGDAVLLPHPAMAGHAILIENRPDIATEIDAAMYPSGNKEVGGRPDDPSKRDSGHGPGHAEDHLLSSPDVKASPHFEPSRADVS